MPGVAMQTIHIASNDATTGSPIDITTTCTGASSPLVTLPSTISLGEIRTGTTLPPTTIQVISTGAPLTLTGMPQLDTPDPNFALTAYSQGTTPATFTLTVTPTSDEIIANHITISDTAGDSVTIPIAGNVVTPSYDVPAMLSLGTFCVSSATTASAVVLRSTGDGTIGLPAAPKMMSATTPFDLELAAPLVYPTSIVPGGSAAVEIAPKRTGLPGTQTDNLVWTTDVTGQATRSSTITAVFVSNGGAIAPSSLDFGQVPVHLVEDNGKRVTLQNCDTTTLSLDTPSIGNGFSIVSPNFPAVLMPNESTTFSIGFAPVELGIVHEQLTITSTMLPNPLVVDLTGEGIAGSGDDDAGSSGPGLVDSSFYACGCRSTEPSGAIVMIVAFGYVLRRRRRTTTSAATTIGQPREGASRPLHEQA
jgi:MYXO-CTERM domain-containing protein